MSDKCCCGHDHEHEHEEMEMEVITLTLDDDTELECAVLGVFDVDEKDYIALLPIVDEDDEEADEAVLLYEYFEEGEDLRLENIEDDEVFKKVSDAFEKLASEWDEEEE